jgi:hypothetical protein
MTPHPQVVSLFCGAGGMDLGFTRAGFRLVRGGQPRARLPALPARGAPGRPR